MAQIQPLSALEFLLLRLAEAEAAITLVPQGLREALVVAAPEAQGPLMPVVQERQGRAITAEQEIQTRQTMALAVVAVPVLLGGAEQVLPAVTGVRG